ncbi:MAG TPA: hypothetical protein VF397_09750 [Pyrinomonadaceae bacterium]
MNKQLTTELTTAKTSSGNVRAIDVSTESAKAAPQGGKSIVELIPQYILTAIGVIYAAGFLVMLSFLDRFGIRDPGNRKIRYIHIGILCLAFPIILNGTIFALSHLILHGKFQTNMMWQRLLPIGLLVINLEAVCFILIMVIPLRLVLRPAK